MTEESFKPSVAVLKEVKLFQSLSEAELEKLSSMGSCSSCEAHTNIIIEGEQSWGIYVILEGMVGVYKTNKLTGNNYDIGQLKSGSFFGEMSLIDDSTRSATVRSLTSCTLFFISKDVFQQFLNSTPGLNLRFYSDCVRILVSRLRTLDDNYVISQFQLWQTALRKEEEVA